jgi:hypothetical protein
MPPPGSAAGMGSLEDVEAATEEVPLMTGVPAGSGSGAEQGETSSGEIPSSAGTCRICLETSPLEELEEACACKGSLQVTIDRMLYIAGTGLYRSVLSS